MQQLVVVVTYGECYELWMGKGTGFGGECCLWMASGLGVGVASTSCNLW